MRKMTLLAGALLLAFGGCRKAPPPELETFTVSGTITDCYTGAPIPGVRIHAEEQVGGWGGPLNVSRDAGDAYTDAQGHYSLSPYRLDGANWLFLTVQKDGYSGADQSYRMQDIAASGSRLISYDATIFVPRFGYVKVIANNIHPADSNDLFYLRIYSIGSSCANGTAAFVRGSAAVTDDGYNQTIRGMGQQAFVVDKVAGGDSVVVSYNVRRLNKYDSALRELRAYAPLNDTTVLMIDY